MKISEVNIFKLDVALKSPFKIALTTLTRAENVVIRVATDTGLVGWGEASPLAIITGDNQESNIATAKRLALLIKDKDPLAIEARMSEIKSFTIGDPSVRSAFDMALYDLSAKAVNLPLYKYLGGERREIRTNMTIGLYDSVEQTVACARDLLARGFQAIKIKVGRSNLEDVPHVKAVRECVGPDVSIKIDSNQGWDYPGAVANINAMAGLNILYSEQPLAAWDIDNLARLRNTVSVPICADESVFDEKDALRLIKRRAVDYLNIKLGKCGGLHIGLKINAVAEAAGCKCMLGCFNETRLGLSAAAHLAMARPNIAFLDLDSACGLQTDVVVGGMKYDSVMGGLIHLPDAPGHGASINETYLRNHACAVVTV